MIHLWMGQQNEKIKIRSSSWPNSPLSPHLLSLPRSLPHPAPFGRLSQPQRADGRGRGPGRCCGWSRLRRAFSLCVSDSDNALPTEVGGFPSRIQSTGDQLLKAKEKKKKKEPKYPKGSIWARSFDLAHSWCSDFGISSVFRIARVCSWWGGGTRRGGRQTTKTRREVSPRHVLSWRLQIASLWANHNSNNDAGRRTWGHRLPETILSFARGS